jgi:L-ascorbate metabolism protein UlaG (beta-lactamase superfamily)
MPSLSISSLMREFEIALQEIGEVALTSRASYDTAWVRAIIGIARAALPVHWNATHPL